MARCEPRKYQELGWRVFRNWTHDGSLFGCEFRGGRSQRDSRWCGFSPDWTFRELAGGQRKSSANKFLEFTETTLPIIVLISSAGPSERAVGRRKSRQHRGNECARIGYLSTFT